MFMSLPAFVFSHGNPNDTHSIYGVIQYIYFVAWWLSQNSWVLPPSCEHLANLLHLEAYRDLFLKTYLLIYLNETVTGRNREVENHSKRERKRENEGERDKFNLHLLTLTQCLQQSCGCISLRPGPRISIWVSHMDVSGCTWQWSTAFLGTLAGNAAARTRTSTLIWKFDISSSGLFCMTQY